MNPSVIFKNLVLTSLFFRVKMKEMEKIMKRKGLKSKIACLVCCMAVIAGANVGSGFTLAEGKNIQKQNKNIITEFLNSKKLNDEVGEKTVSILKQENDTGMICSFMKNVSPDLYEMYTENNVKAENFSKVSIFCSILSIGAGALTGKFAFDIYKIRRENSEDYSDIEEMLNQKAKKIKMRSFDEIWESTQKRIQSEESNLADNTSAVANAEITTKSEVRTIDTESKIKE